MTKRGAADRRPDRAELEHLMSADMRAITAQSDRIGRHFARKNEVSGNDFHALLHIMVAETAGSPLTLAALRQRMDVSPPAITYLVDRMIDAGHIRREPDPADRRKQLLRYEDSGMELARSFFTPLGEQLRAAMADLPDRDLQAAHRVFSAMISAMSTFEAQLAASAETHSVPAAKPPASTKVRRRVPQQNGT
ncbi:MarR family transcriptional regulator [Mycobacterium intermedium]|uniref:MarR family transcriptional regulator n=1 Tax=Mycobacterium intermedium TaxID=28445 RepID=A0A1E3S826_MYCIE|nr:MarR family transcriptional regulator [Mycobacterium intermedium]MCV6964178.1 MarR family transcriptional regulator [Mycobacterium intermedium]ODQ98318.1 MarR family transcriptional regulator [Mycobacterium intermedium]OPE47729.1 MarR family transcriptional regulator [Mycobacterium intermedium]ORB03359.1 MarR family transcriptional regulator [Mycobacterium intermedium]